MRRNKGLVLGVLLALLLGACSRTSGAVASPPPTAAPTTTASPPAVGPCLSAARLRRVVHMGNEIYNDMHHSTRVYGTQAESLLSAAAMLTLKVAHAVKPFFVAAEETVLHTAAAAMRRTAHAIAAYDIPAANKDVKPAWSIFPLLYGPNLRSQVPEC